ncbi:MAG: L-fucose isomerase [Oscillospiraceae bacterium]|nr:L-fucose isomerase [Oscillospiraceae bacterium]
MYPRIGIRPVIDGRRFGVRESLEEKTAAMARAAKELISENCCYPDGKPVECVITPFTIGCGAEAARAEEYFSDLNVTATLTVSACRAFVAETMDHDPISVKAVWGFNSTKLPGGLYLAAAVSAYASSGLPVFPICAADVQDADDMSIPPDVSEKLLRFARCAVAVGWMRSKTYVGLGTYSEGIGGSYSNALFMQKYLGIRPEWVDMTEILRRIHLDIYDRDEYEKALDWTHRNCPVGMNANTDKSNPGNKKLMTLDEQWEFCVKMTLIVHDIMLGSEKLRELGWEEEAEGKNAVFGGFGGQRMWSDWLPNGEFTGSILNTSFDWNGKKQPFILSPGNDCLNGTEMLFGSLLSSTASVSADMRIYWSPEAFERVTGEKPDVMTENGFLHLLSAGSAALDGSGLACDEEGTGMMKRWWELDENDINTILRRTDWCPVNLMQNRGGGFSSHFRVEAEMPVTLIGLSITDGIGPVIRIAQGYTVVLPDDIHHMLTDKTDRTHPTTWFVPELISGRKAFGSVNSVISNWGSDRCAYTYGHIGRDVITLASMLRIPVAVHNVPEEDIFRPHSWISFGAASSEDADFRACAYYGPLYG